MPTTKGMIYIIIDSFHPRALAQGLQQGKLPALSFLIKNGSLDEGCVSNFPTMTPACTSALATGAPPSRHTVPGIVWYHRGERRIINYNFNWLSLFQRGLQQKVQDLVFNLNHRHLSWEVQTIYEQLEVKGILTAAVNPFFYRANTAYSVRLPFIIKLLTLFELSDMKIFGPQGFCLGQLYQPPGKLRQIIKDIRYWRKFGLNDEFSVRAAAWFLQQKQRPRLLTIYFPDTDKAAHAQNADCCHPCLTKLDQKIAELLNCFPSWQEALNQYTFLVVGDHAQSTLTKGRQALIKIPRRLAMYAQAKPADEYIEEKDIAICSNERMAYIYILRYRPGMRKHMVKCLLEEPQLDQVIWQEAGWYHVATHRGNLSFRKGGQLKDDYHNRWEVVGDKAALDMTVEGEQIRYGVYPNALERISHCLDNPHAGELVITAKPGYILQGEGNPGRPGKGSHGSLHQEDSLVPLIISGTSQRLDKPRLIDIVPFIKSLLLNDDNKQ
ncbi:alkaline phosphatase family protein [Desulforamulus hydrothermalis]|uniref:Type I phosphodiesterase/nucleotide pyrophosphatase n=1 Tax=Desulforamulus hydrothermalis Lam5 = DSM 18033 TaxID=1121428 RepID=K8EEJ1_9FIRM|nr:alkaline phosphatase family protein [Desulforamulus hydrothermalis]CCO07201.1 Type I phosphodiesterase/nucleotide pyrophosphatase [Desulforamulus hydrothermalis Lam5 = DSM 18033]SHG88000.1 Type I phosphodiesterase / nucleotide pyrophosphatase [Desulforamulus hydrothermalis Lam5 = DSM 18033]